MIFYRARCLKFLTFSNPDRNTFCPKGGAVYLSPYGEFRASYLY